MAFVTAPAFTRATPSRTPVQRRPAPRACTARMGLRAVESYDGNFTLSEEVSSTLNSMLLDASLSAYVANQAKREAAEFVGHLFQPVPYSVSTPHGMPREMEQYYRKEDFAIINVPPQIMFKAKCYKPSRLCAVFRLMGGVATEEVKVGKPDSHPEWNNLGEAFRNTVGKNDVPEEKLDEYVV